MYNCLGDLGTITVGGYRDPKTNTDYLNRIGVHHSGCLAVSDSGKPPVNEKHPFVDTPWNMAIWGVQTWSGGYVWGLNKEDIESYPTRAPNTELVKSTWGEVRKKISIALK